MFTFSSIIFFTFLSKFLKSSNGLNYVDPGFTRLEYKYATSILRPYVSENTTQCSFHEQFRCFIKTVHFSACQTDIILGFDSVGDNYVHEGEFNYAKNISPFLFGCLARKFSATEKEKRYLWVLDGLNNKNKELKERLKQLYPNCIELLKDCNECQPSFPSYVLEEMIRNCSDEAFKHANVTSFSKKPEPSTIIELEKLSMQKIGSVSTSKAAQHLTFNDLENMKIIASKNPELESFLCSSYSVDLPLTLSDSSHKWFTFDEYKSVKDLLKENQYFRWFFCSGVYAMSSTADLVCFPSKFKNCADILRILPKEDIYLNLHQCRKLAKSNDLHHGAICN